MTERLVIGATAALLLIALTSPAHANFGLTSQSDPYPGIHRETWTDATLLEESPPIHAAGQPQDHPVVTHQGADPGDRVLDDVARRPLAGAAADGADERVDEQLPARCVVHLGVELDAVQPAAGVLDGADRRVGRGRHHLEAGRDPGDVVAVAHPDRALPLDEEAVEERAGLAAGQQLGMAELPLARRHHLAAEVTAHELHTVADPQHRHPQLEQLLGHRRRPLLVDRLGTAGQDDSGRGEGADRGQIHVEGVQLAVDMGLPHPPGDQLGVL